MISTRYTHHIDIPLELILWKKVAIVFQASEECKLFIFKSAHPPPPRKKHIHTDKSHLPAQTHARMHFLFRCVFCFVLLLVYNLCVTFSHSYFISPSISYPRTLFPIGQAEIVLFFRRAKTQTFPPKLITLSPSGKRNANLYYLSLHQSS